MSKFKVGDRVIAKGRAYGVGEHEGVVLSFDDYLVLVEFGDGWSDGHDGGRGDGANNRWNFLHRAIRQAPLKVEAGKVYKSRNGQKIGPMYKFNGDSWAVKGSGNLWLDTGERYFRIDRGGPTDLVSEWTEPKVNVAAQADTLSDEYGRGTSATSAASNDNVAKPKFKVGDRVRCVNADDPTLGKIGSITADDKTSVPFRVRYEGFKGGAWPHQDSYWHLPEDLVLASQPTAIVALIEDGQPKPASRPYIHNTVEAATTEANRLAAKHKGQEFGVYVLNGTFQVPKPTYDHEWQRLATSGNKVAAIKELRILSGLGLATAKNAVEDWAARAA